MTNDLAACCLITNHLATVLWLLSGMASCSISQMASSSIRRRSRRGNPANQTTGAADKTLLGCHGTSCLAVDGNFLDRHGPWPVLSLPKEPRDDVRKLRPCTNAVFASPAGARQSNFLPLQSSKRPHPIQAASRCHLANRKTVALDDADNKL